MTIKNKRLLIFWLNDWIPNKLWLI